MTFYNVISAVLFLGAFRELLQAVDAERWPGVCMAMCLAAIVFNDMLSTSHWVELTKTVIYDWKLMLIDLANFVLLALALIAIRPGNNIFNADLPRLGAALNEPWFWSFLAGYWLLLILWSVLSKTLKVRGRLVASCAVAIIFAGQAIVVALNLHQAAAVGRVLALGYLLGYLLSRLRGELSSVAVVK